MSSKTMVMVAGIVLAVTLRSAVAGTTTLQAGHLQLVAQQQGHSVHVSMFEPNGPEFARGPALYEFERGDGTRVQLDAQLLSSSDVVTIQAQGDGLQVMHEIRVAPAGDGFIETITVRNTASEPVRLRDYQIALQRTADASKGSGHSARLDSPSDTNLRVIAVPFRRHADGRMRDWSIADLAAGKAVNSDWQNDRAVVPPEIIDSARGRIRSEGWILTDGRQGLLVAKYNPAHIEFSMIGYHNGPNAALRLGGSSFALHHEPENMQTLTPGASVMLGTTYYLPVQGDWPAGYARFRSLLDELGHGLSKDYKPPINWNELFDVGWYHSDPAALAKHYTRDALLNEAAKAADVGATALYLDPGWEVCEGTTLWGEDRLGPAADLVATLRDRFNLSLAFRTIGRVYRDEFPHDWYVQHTPNAGPYERPCAVAPPPAPERVPVVDDRGSRNLSLLPDARANASSCLPGHDIHKIEHLNDGWYGNSASWISAGEPSWAEIDLGGVYRIDRVRFGSEHAPHYRDRAPVNVRVLLATQYAKSSADSNWRVVAESDADPVRVTREFRFAPCDARYVRLDIAASAVNTARIDEFEVYETAAQPWPSEPRRRTLVATTQPCEPINFWEPCTLNPAWQREKLDRIEKVARAGMVFAMFDEFDWRGPCYATNHGHAVPSTPEGHARAVFNLIRETKRRVPGLLVEAHDPIWPWGMRYLPVYFEQTLDPARRPGSYDENWGFEFMWNPIEDLISGRAFCLYYYNLGCDIPLYDHITAEKDNDACVAFWWYASTIRHLGIGGKKGLESSQENPTRWAAYKQAMPRYRKLHDYFARGRFVGIDELAHLHVLPDKPGGVLVAFNLTDKPVDRTVVLDAGELKLAADTVVASAGELAATANGLELRVSIPAMSPLVVELSSAELRPAGKP